MKRVLLILLALAICLAMTPAMAASHRVGIAMPTQSLQRWNQDGANMKALMEEAGYEVDLQYANNEVNTQISQIENMILGGAEILVISSIDGSALDTVLALAKEVEVPVIAYDRLLTNTMNVDYYATFDNYRVGVIQGMFVEEMLDLANAEGPFTIEFTAGDPGDNNAGLFFGGAYDVLKPYIESGKLVIKSGQTEFAQCAAINWSTQAAQDRMDNILSAYYADGTKLDVCLCSNDNTALGVINSLRNFGFSDENMPLITGQDCDIAGIKNIIGGYQAMSVFKDTRVLAAQTVKMVGDLLEGRAPETNAVYANGLFDVPSYNCAIMLVGADNYQEILIDSGYYTADQLAD